MRKKQAFMVMMASLVFFAVISCNKDESEDDPAVINLRLTDAPGPYDEVNVDIQQVEIKSTQGTFMMNVNAGIYNLLDFVNGNDTLFATAGIPSQPNGFLIPSWKTVLAIDLDLL